MSCIGFQKGSTGKLLLLLAVKEVLVLSQPYCNIEVHCYFFIILVEGNVRQDEQYVIRNEQYVIRNDGILI